MAETDVLCLREASQKFKAGAIGEDEYYHHVLAHCTGYLHDQDDDDPSAGISMLQWEDPFAFGVECFMKRKDFIKDATPLEEAFRALRTQDIQRIKEAATRLGDSHAKFLRKILAFRALQLRKAGVLRHCLDVGGFPYEAYFEDEADRVREEEDPKTFEVLEGSHFRKVYPRKPTEEALDEDEEQVMEGLEGDDYVVGETEREKRKRDEIAATFDRGGKFPVDW